MDTKPVIAGSHIYLFREGETFTLPAAGGTAGRDARPGILANKVANDIAGTEDTTTDDGWFMPGYLKSLKVDKSTTETPIMRPNPGAMERYDILRTGKMLDFTGTVTDVGAALFEFLFDTDALDSTSTTYTAFEGATKRCWVHIEQYDHENALINTYNGFCDVTVTSIEWGDGEVTYDLVCKQLMSTLNGGTLVASS